VPLEHSSSPSAFKSNVKTLMDEYKAGTSPHVKSRAQALAIAYSEKRRAKKRAVGGMNLAPLKPPNMNPSFVVRNEARQMTHTGPILSAVPGRTDNHQMAVPSGSYVIPAETISHMGQSNTLAGMQAAHNMFGPNGPYGAGADMRIGHGAGAPRPPKLMGSDTGGARGSGQAGVPVDVMTAGGEYVISPSVVKNIGGGDISHGHKVLDAWVMSQRKDHIRTLKHLKPPAKS
jgi:hypothetical protein